MEFLIYGSKDFGQTISEMLFDCGMPFKGYIDDFDRGENIVGTWEEICRRYSNLSHAVVVGIGYTNLKARAKVYGKIVDAGYQTPAIVHPRAYVARTATIGAGCIIMANATVDARAKIEDFSVIWPGAVVCHDAVVNSNVFISPNATVCGFSSIGQSSFVGAGATVVDRLNMPEFSFVKAGALVKEVPHSKR